MCYFIANVVSNGRTGAQNRCIEAYKTDGTGRGVVTPHRCHYDANGVNKTFSADFPADLHPFPIIRFPLHASSFRTPRRTTVTAPLVVAVVAVAVLVKTITTR